MHEENDHEKKENAAESEGVARIKSGLFEWPVYCWVMWRHSWSTWVDLRRTMMHPPNPPPVIRAPIAPAPRASSTNWSSAKQLTRYKSRRDAWLSNIRRPNRSRSPSIKAWVAFSVRSFSCNTCNASFQSDRSRPLWLSTSWSIVIWRKQDALSDRATRWHAWRRRAYSLAARSCRTCELITRRTQFWRRRQLIGTGFTWFERQSMWTACVELPEMTASWSITPHGTPAKSCSACWQIRARSRLLCHFDHFMLIWTDNQLQIHYSNLSPEVMPLVLATNDSRK